MTGRTKMQVGRLALRHEGAMWNAYYAHETTMDGALFLGSIAMSVVAGSEARKTEFMDLMRSVVSDIIRDATGAPVTWGGPKRAPERERSGHG